MFLQEACQEASIRLLGAVLLVVMRTFLSNGNGALPTPPAEWRDLVLCGVGEGQRNYSVTRLAGYLLRRHVDPLVALEFLTAWNATRCLPPLDTAEVARIVDSIAGRELKRRDAG